MSLGNTPRGHQKNGCSGMQHCIVGEVDNGLWYLVGRKAIGLGQQPLGFGQPLLDFEDHAAIPSS